MQVLDLAGLQSELTAAQTDGQQRTVLVFAALDTSVAGNYPPPECLRAEDCPQVVGEIVGVPGRAVWATPEVAQSVRDGTYPLAKQLLALSFGNAPVITLLGLVNPSGPVTVLWPADEPALAGEADGPLAHAVAVHGWLSWSGALPCPLPALPTPPPNSPFQTCPGAWITPESYQPVHPGRTTPPSDGIRVQWEAYQDFAGAPSDVNPPPPVEGTWLLRLVADPRPNRTPARGWQMVGRLNA